MNRVDQAVSCFKEGFTCSQLILSTYAPQLGLDRVTALKIAGPFGGGLGRMGETCGVVTGSIMVIGLKSGWIKADDKEAKEKCYSLAREFIDRFKSRNISVLCRDLIDCDISTPEGLKSAREKRLFITVCPQFVQDAAEILEQIL